MATQIQIQSTNYNGQLADITFYPCSGGTISLGYQTIPYTYTNDYYEGTYDLFFSAFNQTCQLVITCPTPTPTITPTNTATPTPTITPTVTMTPTLTQTPTPSPGPSVNIGNRLALDAASYPGAGNWNDISGNGNVISLINSPTYSSSNGGYFTFNGTNQYGTAPNSASLSITGTNFTCEYWVKSNVIGDYIIVAKAPYNAGPSNQNGNYMLWYSDNYELFFTTADPSVTQTNARNATFTMDTNWHQVVYQYSAGTGTFYMDGTIMTTTGPDGFDLFPTIEPLQIARREDGFGYLNGNLSIVNIWDYPLTNTEIVQNWNYYRTRYGI